jgi:uncharacterized protein (DUF2141 family)
VFDCACGLCVGTIDTACGCGYNSATITPGQFAIKFRGRVMTARCICFFAILMSISDEAQSLTAPLANHQQPRGGAFSRFSSLAEVGPFRQHKLTAKIATTGAAFESLFAPPVLYGSGGYQANAVAVADVNGDGKLDLIVANVCPAGGCIEISGGAVGVLLGNGDGTFQTAAVYGGGSIIGAGGNSIVVADVNADGKPDLVLANDCLGDCLHGIVGVQFGNGNGTFQSETVLFSAGLTRSVAVADVNGDGKLDLVVGKSDVAVRSRIPVWTTTAR